MRTSSMKSHLATHSLVKISSVLMVYGAHGARGRPPRSLAIGATNGATGQSLHIRQHVESLCQGPRKSSGLTTLVFRARSQVTAYSATGEHGPTAPALASVTLSALAPSSSMPPRVDGRALVISRRRLAVTQVSHLVVRGARLLQDVRVLLRSPHVSIPHGLSGLHAARHATVAMQRGTAQF